MELSDIAQLHLLIFVAVNEGKEEEAEEEEEKDNDGSQSQSGESAKSKSGRKSLKEYQFSQGMFFYFYILIPSDKLENLKTFVKEVTIKLDVFPGKFNFITFPTDKAPCADWIKAHLNSNGFFLVLSKTFEQASHSVNLFKDMFAKLTEYYIKGYREIRNPEASHVFKTETVILQIWGFKKRVEELAKQDVSYWPSGPNFDYLCKY